MTSGKMKAKEPFRLHSMAFVSEVQDKLKAHGGKPDKLRRELIWKRRAEIEAERFSRGHFDFTPPRTAELESLTADAQVALATLRSISMVRSRPGKNGPYYFKMRANRKWLAAELRMSPGKMKAVLQALSATSFLSVPKGLDGGGIVFQVSVYEDCVDCVDYFDCSDSQPSQPPSASRARERMNETGAGPYKTYDENKSPPNVHTPPKKRQTQPYNPDPRPRIAERMVMTRSEEDTSKRKLAEQFATLMETSEN